MGEALLVFKKLFSKSFDTRQNKNIENATAIW